MHNRLASVVRFVVVMLIAAGVGGIGGCCLPAPRTVDLAAFDVGAGEVGGVGVEAAGPERLLVVPLLGEGRHYGADRSPAHSGIQGQALSGSERELLVDRLGKPIGINVEVVTPAELGSAGLTAAAIGTYARERGAHWVLVTSVDSVGTGPSMFVLVSLLTFGVLPFNIGCTGCADAALFDLQTGKRLERWTFDDSGWQVANIITATRRAGRCTRGRCTGCTGASARARR